MIEIGGLKRPIYGNINGLIELKKDHGVDIVNGFSKESFSFEMIRSLVFVALKYGHRKEYGKNKEFDVTLEDVGDWLTPSTIEPIMKAVTSCFVGDVPSAEGQESGEPIGVQ